MRKGITILTLSLMFGAAAAHADEPRQGAPAQSSARSKAFQKFRKEGLANFQDFRKKVLEQYADFLNGEWHEFESIMEEDSPYTQPKPQTLPEYVATAEDLETNTMMSLPAPVEGQMALSVPKTKVGKFGNMRVTASDAAGKSNYELAVLKIPDPNFAFGPFPGQTKAPRPGEAGMSNSDEAASPKEDGSSKGKDRHFDFYGMDAYIPEVDFTIAKAIESTSETGANWKKMAEQPGGVETARQLFGLAQQLGLNGYLTFRLTESYVNQRFPESNDKARMAAVHFLLSNMGYDVRLTTLGDIFTVMLPFDQKVVYGLFPNTIDGRKYYAMFPEGYKKPKAGTSVTMSTCKLPGDALGKSSDLRLTGLNLPMKPKEFEVTRNGLTIKGVVNENLKELLHRYPQMPTGDFASSWIDQQLRDDIVAQLQAQLGDMTETQAINTLMSLCHYGFDYSTDQDYHGFEKPYFFEENFIYDKNDCEDRAIFFSYLVWNVLGLPCQLIQYPGHESVTIAAASDIQGCYYDTSGTKFYSSDPTYRGSRIGMVMPYFKTTSPSIDKQYGGR